MDLSERLQSYIDTHWDRILPDGTKLITMNATAMKRLVEEAKRLERKAKNPNRHEH